MNHEELGQPNPDYVTPKDGEQVGFGFDQTCAWKLVYKQDIGVVKEPITNQ